MGQERPGRVVCGVGASEELGEAAGSEQPAPPPRIRPLKAHSAQVRIERGVEAPAYGDEVIALAQDRMIRPGQGDKATRHFRKSWEAEWTWFTGDVEGEGESRVTSGCQLGFIKKCHPHPLVGLFPLHTGQLAGAPAP